MNTKKNLVGIALTSLISVPALADNFEAEAGLILTDSSYEIGPAKADLDSITVVGSLYFDAVDTSKGPLAEAVFLDQASGISASFSDVDDPGDNAYSLSGRFVTSNSMIIEASYVDDEFDTQTYGIGIGTYITDKSDIVVSYATNDDLDFDVLAADYHSLMSLSGGASLSYSVVVEYIDSSDDSGFGVGGDVTYYMDQYLGFGVYGSTREINDSDVTTFGFQGSYFISPDFYVIAFVQNIDFDGPEQDSIGVGAFLRF